MRGLLIVNKINDVFYQDCDTEFVNHVNKQAVEQGLLQAGQYDEKELDSSIVMQLFSPLFMSQWFLIEQRRNPCSSISCENGFLFVFKQYEEFLIVAISQDKEDTELFLRKKIGVLIRVIEFLFGPVTNEIGYSIFCRRNDRWRFLQNLMKTWELLRKEEHSFLVEAIERLHVNQLVNEKCMEILENAINRLQSAGEKNTHHALLIINSKLLSLYSNRNSPLLAESDVLCIILLARLLFPTNEKLEDLFSYRKPDDNGGSEEMKSPASITVTPPRDRYESAVEGEDSVDEDNYMSATETPSTKIKAENPYPAVSEHVTEEEITEPEHKVLEGITEPEHRPGDITSEGYTTPDSSPSITDLNKLVDNSGRLTPIGRSRSRTFGGVTTGRITPGPGRARSRSLNQDNQVIRDNTPLQRNSSPLLRQEPEQPMSPVIRSSPDHIRQTAFLSTQLCSFSPYQLDFIQIFPGMVIVLLSEIPRAHHAGSLCQLLRLLNDLLSGQKTQVQRVQGHVLYDLINTILYKLASAMKKARGNIERILEDIRKRWDNAEFKSALLSYLEQGAGTDIPPGAERSLTGLHKKVKDLFLHLYLYPYDISPSVSQAMSSVCERAKVKMFDYKDYLSVKSQRNIVMTSYLDAFPGLVHFIYIDRRTNQLTAPSLNITEEGEILDATQFLKNKIWTMTSWMYSKLTNGVTVAMAREGDYYFSYFLWFTDFQGTPLPVQHTYQEGDINVLPGILSGQFYTGLKRHCFPNMIPISVNCYELIMMHVGLVNVQYIISHRQKLAKQLFEASGDTQMNLVL
ncbi:BLOC-3 complex member HPS1-like [Saccostrea echinata]|uniref:BLOC-3 complex member HPS1-like n=1 Tax=Saccostrea echinata TaxID=191078 RepID=UPI002A8049D4|nr:BLOC-3 complex member HPS1-like [Saccostrea echinata]